MNVCVSLRVFVCVCVFAYASACSRMFVYDYGWL